LTLVSVFTEVDLKEISQYHRNYVRKILKTRSPTESPNLILYASKENPKSGQTVPLSTQLEKINKTRTICESSQHFNWKRTTTHNLWENNGNEMTK
jgi:hypothetical protein